MCDSRDVWQDTFDDTFERTGDVFFANKQADEAVADYISAQADTLYDHWRDMED